MSTSDAAPRLFSRRCAGVRLRLSRAVAAERLGRHADGRRARLRPRRRTRPGAAPGMMRKAAPAGDVRGKAPGGLGMSAGLGCGEARGTRRAAQARNRPREAAGRTPVVAAGDIPGWGCGIRGSGCGIQGSGCGPRDLNVAASSRSSWAVLRPAGSGLAAPANRRAGRCRG